MSDKKPVQYGKNGRPVRVLLEGSAGKPPTATARLINESVPKPPPPPPLKKAT